MKWLIPGCVGALLSGAILIFVLGLSTSEQVTNISGRGVGLDAVKAFLLARGGNISLQLLSANTQSNMIGCGVMVPFELIVELPESAFIAMNQIAKP